MILIKVCRQPSLFLDSVNSEYKTHSHKTATAIKANSDTLSRKKFFIAALYMKKCFMCNKFEKNLKKCLALA
jgi:hypothetical protein